MNIYLLGFRAAGKSSLLRAISFSGSKVDIDEKLEAEFGESILQFVQREGVERFREREFAALSALEAGDSSLLIATGGGILDWPASRDLLARSPGHRLYLRTAPELLWDRLKAQPERLVIGGIDSYDKFFTLFEQRRPHYEALATKSIENTSLEKSREEIEHWLFTVPGFMK